MPLVGPILVAAIIALSACAVSPSQRPAAQQPSALQPERADNAVSVPAAVIEPGLSRVAVPRPTAVAVVPIVVPAEGLAGGSPAVSSAATSPPTTPDQRGAVLESRRLDTFDRDQIDQLIPRLYPSGTSLPAKYAVDRFLVRFQSTGAAGEPLPILAHMYVPRVERSAPLPVLVYGAGTTGLSAQCAPLKENATVRNWGDYFVHMLSYAAQGYIAILPNYAGFDDETQLQRYFVADLEGRVLLDAARAVYRFFEDDASSASSTARPDSAVFFAGYSQGGHAAFAVRDTASSYAPDVAVKGVIGHGATTDLIALLKDSPYFAPYLLYALADYYGSDAVDVRELLQPEWLPSLAYDVTGMCIDAVRAHYGNDPRELYQTAFREALYDGRLEDAFPALKEVLDRNSTGLAPSGIPALVVQGTADPIVSIQSQDAFVAKLCSAGGKVTYPTYPGLHHFQTRQVGFKDTLAWMETLRAGGDPSNVCSPLG